MTWTATGAWICWWVLLLCCRCTASFLSCQGPLSVCNPVLEPAHTALPAAAPPLLAVSLASHDSPYPQHTATPTHPQVATMNGNLYCIATGAPNHPLKSWPQQHVGGGTFTARCGPGGAGVGLVWPGGRLTAGTDHGAAPSVL